MPRQLAVRLAARLAEVEGVVAVALGGSTARPDGDEHADVDLGIYYHPERPLAVEQVRTLAAELDERGRPDAVTDVGVWGPWINGGAWLRVDGRRVDWLYRDLGRVATTIEDCRAGRATCDHQLGHPDGFHNHIYAAEVHYAASLFDPLGVLTKLKQAVAEYPPALQQALIGIHLSEAEFWLAGCEHSARRGDVFHVSGSFFRAAASLVQVVCAANGHWWINEKQALAATASLPLTPPGFAGSVAEVLARPGRTPAELVANLDRLHGVAAAVRAVAGPLLRA